MGGEGSTRWRGHRKATTVEECRTVLNLERLARGGALAAGRQGTLR
jgi:hypothetical protein